MNGARVRLLGLAGVLVACATAVRAEGTAIGPSFRCPVPSDPLGQLVCKLPSLARADLALVQAFEALRMQDPSRRADLSAEAVAFSRSLRDECQVRAGALPPVAAVTCIEKRYAQQRAHWMAPLSGAALQEANRPLERQVALQRDLASLGLLPAGIRIDGVYASATRTAIVAFQQTEAVTATGLLGEHDAALLADRAARTAPPASGQAGTQASVAVPPSGSTAPASPADPAAWRAAQAALAEAGLTLTAGLAPDCAVRAAVADPVKLAAAIRHSRPDLAGDDDVPAFAAMIGFLDGALAAPVVRSFYRSWSRDADRCRFSFVAYTRTLYGQDEEKPLFSFLFNRALFDRVNWNHVDPANLPRIAMEFALSPDTQRKMLPAPADTTGPARAPVADTAHADAQAAIADWSGTASLTTRPFHAEGPWELQWRSGGAFRVILHRSGSTQTSLVADAAAAASSSAYQPEGGEYFLEIDGTDPWHARVVPVPSP